MLSLITAWLTAPPQDRALREDALSLLAYAGCAHGELTTTILLGLNVDISGLDLNQKTKTSYMQVKGLLRNTTFLIKARFIRSLESHH